VEEAVTLLAILVGELPVRVMMVLVMAPPVKAAAAAQEVQLRDTTGVPAFSLLSLEQRFGMREEVVVQPQEVSAVEAQEERNPEARQAEHPTRVVAVEEK
jgi:hypothetical protein